VVRKVYINYDKAEISTSQEIYGTVAVNSGDRVIPLTLQYYRHGSRSKQIIFADKYIHFSNYPSLLYSFGGLVGHSLLY
jgi:hypothetical protein